MRRAEWGETFRLNVSIAADVSEDSTARDACVFGVLVEELTGFVADVEGFACALLIGFEGLEGESAVFEVINVDGNDFRDPQETVAH